MIEISNWWLSKQVITTHYFRVTMSELRFSLAERKPDGIKSTGDSGTTITLSDPNAKSILDEIHNATTENHTSVTDWYHMI